MSLLTTRRPTWPSCRVDPRHLRLTRSGRADLVLLTEDEFASMQETIALADAYRPD